jgi:hypothetical protein
MSLATIASADSEQRLCTFEKAITTTGETLDVFWEVIATQNEANARVIVKGSGDYSGNAKNSANGAAEFTFTTQVSTEVITVGPTGEAAWQIDFQNGETMAYFGYCDAAKRTN